MLHYASVFLVIALIAALFGFGGIAAGAASIAKVLCVLFLILALASFLYGLTRRCRFTPAVRTNPLERSLHHDHDLT